MAGGREASPLIALLLLLYSCLVYGDGLEMMATPLELVRIEGGASLLLSSFRFCTGNFVSLKQLFDSSDFGFRYLYGLIVEPLSRVIQLTKVSRNPILQKLLLGPRKLQNNPALRRLIIGLPRRQLATFKGNLFTVAETLADSEREQAAADGNEQISRANLLQQETRFVIYPNMQKSVSLNLLNVLMSDEHIVRMKNLAWMSPLRAILTSPKSMCDGELARNMLVPVLAEIISESENADSLLPLLSTYIEAGSPTAKVKLVRLLITELAISSYNRRTSCEPNSTAKAEVLKRIQREILDFLWPSGPVATLRGYLRSNHLLPSEEAVVLDLAFVYIKKLDSEVSRTISSSMMVLSLFMQLPLTGRPYYVNTIIDELPPNTAVPLLTIPFFKRYLTLFDSPLHLTKFRDATLPRALRSLQYKRKYFIITTPFVRLPGSIIEADWVEEFWRISTCDTLPLDVQVRKDAAKKQLVYLDIYLIDWLTSSIDHGAGVLSHFYGKEVKLKLLISTWSYMIIHRRRLSMGFIFLAGQEKSPLSWNDWVHRMVPEHSSLIPILQYMLDELKIYECFTINELRCLVDSDFSCPSSKLP